MGGLAKDLAVELADGTMAVVVEVTPEAVKLDATDTDTHTRTHTLSFTLSHPLLAAWEAWQRTLRSN